MIHANLKNERATLITGQVIQDFQQKLQQQPTYDMHPTGTYWTVCDELFAISISKK